MTSTSKNFQTCGDLDNLHHTSPIRNLKFVYLELTVKCNLACNFCNNEVRNLYENLPPERFIEIINQLEPGTRLGLHGLGEPTMHEHLVDFVGQAKRRGLYVYFNTNHTITTDAQMMGFISNGLDELRISLSAGSRKSYECYSGRDLFDAVVYRMRRMIDIRGVHCKPKIRVVFVLTRQNYMEFPSVLTLSEQLGIDELMVQVIQNWGKVATSDQSHEYFGFKYNERAHVNHFLRVSASKVSRIRVFLPPDYASHEDGRLANASGKCQWPFNSTWITANGHVTPCCNLHDPRYISFGNAFVQRLTDIWTNSTYSQFRQQYLSNNIQACINCPINYDLFKTYTYASD